MPGPAAVREFTGLVDVGDLLLVACRAGLLPQRHPVAARGQLEHAGQGAAPGAVRPFRGPGGPPAPALDRPGRAPGPRSSLCATGLGSWPRCGARSTPTGSARWRRRCCRPCTAARRPGPSGRTASPTAWTSPCGSRRSSPSSGWSSPGWDRSTRSGATSATRAPTPPTTRSSPRWRPTSRTPTTTTCAGWPSGSSSSPPVRCTGPRCSRCPPGPDGSLELTDISAPWPVVPVLEAVSRAVGRPVSTDTGLDELLGLAAEHHVSVREDAGPGALIEALYGALVEPLTLLPTFYVDFPEETSPLTRPHRCLPGLVERWDLVVAGIELGTAYSELTDPLEQRRRLVQQSLRAAAGDVEAMEVDEDFLLALELGMPPDGWAGHRRRPPGDAGLRHEHPGRAQLPLRQAAPLNLLSPCGPARPGGRGRGRRGGPCGSGRRRG